jgi:deoxyribodipyrimidine photo-lyase
MKYDEEAVLASTWLPELASLPTEFKHSPFSMTPEQQVSLGCVLGADYPEPIVDPASQIGVLGLKKKEKKKGR